MMIRTFLNSILLGSLIIHAVGVQVHAWGPNQYDSNINSHSHITEYAADQSALSVDHGDFLRNYGFLSDITSVPALNFQHAITN